MLQMIKKYRIGLRTMMRVELMIVANGDYIRTMTAVVIGVLTDSVKPGARSLPHGTKTLVFWLTAAHSDLDRRRRERPVRESR